VDNPKKPVVKEQQPAQTTSGIQADKPEQTYMRVLGLGLTPLQQVLKELESVCRGGEFGKLRQLIPELMSADTQKAKEFVEQLQRLGKAGEMLATAGKEAFWAVDKK
jgi:hypothetical protein